MRSSSLPLLLGCALALALPSVASAQSDYSAIRQPFIYDALPVDGTDPVTEPVTTLTLTSGTWATGYAVIPAPFPTLVFMNEIWSQIDIGTKGYITFNSSTTANKADVSANTALGLAAQPNAIVAAWWDSLNCPTGGIKTQLYGPTGARVFAIEWDNCYLSASTQTYVQMQIRIQESSPIVKVYYGEMRGTGTHSATVGIENGAGTRAFYGLPNCTSNCTGANWPTNTMIQYGRPTLADLEKAGVGLDYKGLQTVQGRLEATVENTVQNGGLTDANGFTWDIYLSLDNRYDPTDALVCSLTQPQSLAGARNGAQSITVPVDCVIDPAPDPGSYYFCVVLDPATATNPNGAILEASEGNNTYCSQSFVIGADLTGSIVSIEPAGGLGSDTTVVLNIANGGTDDTEEFQYNLYWRDCASPSGDRTLAYTGTTSLVGGESITETLRIFLDPQVAYTTLCAELVIDEADVIPELVPTNNLASTCYEPNKACMALTRPNLTANRLLVDLPHGCFFGDLVNFEFEICNEGPTEARNFAAMLGFDDNSYVTVTGDTLAVSVPQSCDPQDENGVPYPDGGDWQCQDIGGGPPKCIKGLCHAPCAGNSNADCGNSGLTCQEDPDFEIDGVRQTSCQLVLDGGECMWVRGTARIPTFNTYVSRPFVDGNHFFTGIVDSTMRIGEGDDEGDNDIAIQQGIQCWTRKADFEPTEVAFVDTVASGESFPIYRRVHNHGVIGSVYSYRYFLSSDDRVSTFDIPLEIVGHGLSADAVVEPFSDSMGYDTVRLPTLEKGTYYLGLLIDADDTVPELREDNNALVWCDPQADGSCKAHPVVVVDSSLRIVTQALAMATVGQSYTVQFLAAGGDGAYEWSISGGQLPPGLTLETNGLLHGTVLEQGDYLFVVTVTSGNSSATKAFPLRVLAAAGPLVITTDRLPPAYLQISYSAELGASGGLPPYSWNCTGFPAWAHLTNNVITGTPAAVANPVPVTCTVTDSQARSLTAVYALQVFNPAGVLIRTNRLDCDLGVHCVAEVYAERGSGSYSFDFVDEKIPSGLREVETENKGVLEGTADRCGTFLVGVTVTDRVSLATDSAEIPMNILCDPPQLTTTSLPDAERNQPYGPVQLVAERALSFRVAIGELPLGLTLSSDGKISGEVVADAAPGPYHVGVEMADAYGGAGLGAITIRVKDPPGPIYQENVEVTKGCSTSGENSASGFLPFAALFALLGLRRFRKSAGVALLAAAVCLPGVASAQDAAGYGQFQRPIVYQRLTGATEPFTGTNLTSKVQEIVLPAGFAFEYFGFEYTKLWASTNGIIFFSGSNTSYTNVKIPTTGTPNNFIAPWWDQLKVHGADFRYMFRGQAPNRELVIEWIARSYSSDTDVPMEMQVSLYENDTFAMRWGNPGTLLSGTATVGIEDLNGTALSKSLLPCSATSNTCNRTDWDNSLKNTEVVYARIADLKVVSTSTQAEGRAGIDQTFTVTVENQGPKAAYNTSIELLLSLDPVASDDDATIGTIRDVTVPGGPNKRVTKEITLPIPRSVDAGVYYLVARVDPENVVPEFSDDDNAGGSFRVLVREPMPDLAIDSVWAPTSGTPGSKIAVDLSVTNLGNQDANNVPYWVVLSNNEAISPDDLVIYEGTVNVRWLESTPISVLVEIPVQDVPVGVYHLGAVIDPLNEFPEFDELNNLGKAPNEFRVTAAGLRITTQVPTELQVGAPFCIPLAAEGGDGVYTWSVIENDLPPGLEILVNASGTSLCGEPTEVGLFEFTLQVESGGMTAQSELSLSVVTVPLRLTVSSRVLPIAMFNTLYEAGLAANGGRPPYHWSLVDGALPTGLTLDDDGLIFGIPYEDSAFAFTVRVTDDLGQTAVQVVRLQVASPGRITCVARSLGTLKVGDYVSGKLLAGGGKPPYLWTTSNTQRFGDENAPAIDEELPPPGIRLGATGDLDGQALEVGKYIWTVKVTDDDENPPDTCTISVEVVAGQGLTVTTTKLPMALVDTDYAVQLTAAGGSGKLNWATPGYRMPSGLSLSKEGLLTGRLTTADLQGNPTRTYSFMVEVRDAANNVGTAPLSVTLTTPKRVGPATRETVTTETGCSTTAGGFSLLALGLVALGLRRRR